MKYKFKNSRSVLIALSAFEKDIYICRGAINKLIRITPLKIKLEKYHI